MSFYRKSRDRSAENTSGADDRAPKNEGEISFEPLHKYFDKKIDEQKKIMELKFYSDARQIEKKLKLSIPEREINFKFKGNKIQHQFNVKLVEEFENISFRVSEGSVSRVKKKMDKLVEESSIVIRGTSTFSFFKNTQNIQNTQVKVNKSK